MCVLHIISTCVYCTWSNMYITCLAYLFLTHSFSEYSKQDIP